MGVKEIDCVRLIKCGCGGLGSVAVDGFLVLVTMKTVKFRTRESRVLRPFKQGEDVTTVGVCSMIETSRYG